MKFTITIEDSWSDGCMPFLDILIITKYSGILTTHVYRKSTHMDQYLYWESQHHIGAKYYIINTLIHRVKVTHLCQNCFKQKKQLREVPTNCKYPSWALSRMECNNSNRINSTTAGRTPIAATTITHTWDT